MIAYIINLLIIIGIYIILAASLNLAMGYTGLMNLGHIAFFGIGAYSSAILTQAGWSFLWAFLASGIVTACFGYLLTVAVRKLKGDYLALSTLAFSFVIVSVLLNWTSVTRGPLGIPGIGRPEIFGWLVRSNFDFLILIYGVVFLTLLVLARLTSSRYGRLLEAVRDDAVGAAVLGKNVFRLKSQSMAISAFFAGLSGSLFAHYITFIDPASFYLEELILILTIVMVGGLASLKGSVLATAVILLIPEVLRFVDLPLHIIGPFRQIIYALLLLAILMIRPKGFLGKVELE